MPDYSRTTFVDLMFFIPLRVSTIKLESAADCVVIVTDHKDFDYNAIEADSSLIVDTRNGMKDIKSTKVVRL